MPALREKGAPLVNVMDPVTDALRLSRPRDWRDASDPYGYQWREDVKRIAEAISNDLPNFDGAAFVRRAGLVD